MDIFRGVYETKVPALLGLDTYGQTVRCGIRRAGDRAPWLYESGSGQKWLPRGDPASVRHYHAGGVTFSVQNGSMAPT